MGRSSPQYGEGGCPGTTRLLPGAVNWSLRWDLRLEGGDGLVAGAHGRPHRGGVQ